MKPMELIAQSIGILAMAFNILSYQQKQQKLLREQIFRIIWTQPKMHYKINSR